MASPFVLYHNARFYCTSYKIGYTDTIEKFMKRADLNLSEISLSDKIIRLRNLKMNLEDTKSSDYSIEFINKDARLLKLVESIIDDYTKLSTQNLVYFLNALAYYEIQKPEF